MKIAEALSGLLTNIKNLLSKSVSNNYISSEARITLESFKDSYKTIQIIQENSKIDTSMVNGMRKDKQYQLFFKHLTSPIINEEAKNFFESLKIISDIYITELSNLISYVEHNKETDKLTSVSNVKYSQVTLIGLLEQAIRIDRFVKAFVFKALYSEKIDNYKKDFPWFYKHIDTNIEFVTEQINRYAHTYKSKNISITLNVVNFFKKKQFDPNIIVENQPNTDYSSLFEEDPEIRNLNLLGLPFSINPFTLGANIFVLYNHNRNIQREYEKSWMESQVMALEMKKSRLDPNSEEYKRLEKVIDNYNSLIATATKKIDEYRNS